MVLFLGICEMRVEGLRSVKKDGLPIISSRNDWLRGLDSNQRPLGYEPNELPGCSTPRYNECSLSIDPFCQLSREIKHYNSAGSGVCMAQ